MRDGVNEDNRQITLSQYRGIDVSIFFLIACAIEILNIFIFNKYYTDQNFCISVVLPLSLLVMQRWNAWGGLIAVGGGFAFCIANGDASAASYLVYCAGNCFVLLNLIWYAVLKKERFTESAGWRVLFTVTGYLFMTLGRALMSLPFEGGFFENYLAFLSGDALNAAVGIVVILIAAKQKGLFEDQVAYLKKQAEENKKNSKKQEWIGEEDEREED